MEVMAVKEQVLGRHKWQREIIEEQEGVVIWSRKQSDY